MGRGNQACLCQGWCSGSETNLFSYCPEGLTLCRQGCNLSAKGNPRNWRNASLSLSISNCFQPCQIWLIWADAGHSGHCVEKGFEISLAMSAGNRVGSVPSIRQINIAPKGFFSRKLLCSNNPEETREPAFLAGLGWELSCSLEPLRCVTADQHSHQAIVKKENLMIASTCPQPRKTPDMSEMVWF